MTVTVTMKEFIAAHRITMSCKQVDSNPSMEDSASMDHWKCLLACGRKRMTVTFSMGYGHHGKEPEVAGVLDCLASDAAGVEDTRTFEDWCGDYGYDQDSRRAEKIYKACQHQAARLRTFLGDELYDALLWKTERE